MQLLASYEAVSGFDLVFGCLRGSKEDQQARQAETKRIRLLQNLDSASAESLEQARKELVEHLFLSLYKDKTGALHYSTINLRILKHFEEAAHEWVRKSIITIRNQHTRPFGNSHYALKEGTSL